MRQRPAPSRVPRARRIVLGDWPLDPAAHLALRHFRSGSPTKALLEAMNIFAERSSFRVRARIAALPTYRST